MPGRSGGIPAAMPGLLDVFSDGPCLYGIAPPKLATDPVRLEEIALQQRQRFEDLKPDGLVIYDIQDEQTRTTDPRPYPFLPTIDPELYAREHLARVAAPKIVYRSVAGHNEPEFVRWLEQATAGPGPCFRVLVGAPSSRTAAAGLKLSEAYELVRRHAPHLVLGAIAIAERHARKLDEHERMLAKMGQGCRFFVTQAVYDATSTKSLISDYALALQGQARAPAPVVLTFSPCGSVKTLDFMKWLGISFPRWLENELRYSPDLLDRSLSLCERVFDDVLSYANDKAIPIGINVESVSIRKAEIDASVELFRRLRARLRASRAPQR